MPKRKGWKIEIELVDEGHGDYDEYLSRGEVKTEIQEHLKAMEYQIMCIEFKNLKIRRIK